MASKTTRRWARTNRELPDWIADRLIAEGGQAQTWLVHEDRDEREHFVLKEYCNPDKGRTASLDRLEQYQRYARMEYEAILQAHAGGRHPSIVRAIECHPGDAEHLPYNVLEFIDGTPLDQAARDPHGPDWHLELGLRITETLAVLHKRETAHRDIHWENFILRDANDAGTAVLFDFGIACVARSKTTTMILAQGMGFPGFIPPERALRHHQLPTPPTFPDAKRADVFALAAVLYRIYTARFPYNENLEGWVPEDDSLINFVHYMKRLGELYERVRGGAVVRPEAPVSLAPWLPRALSDVLLTALEVDPQRRYADGLAFHTAFRWAAEGHLAQRRAQALEAKVAAVTAALIDLQRDHEQHTKALQTELAQMREQTARERKAMEASLAGRVEQGLTWIDGQVARARDEIRSHLDASLTSFVERLGPAEEARLGAISESLGRQVAALAAPGGRTSGAIGEETARRASTQGAASVMGQLAVGAMVVALGYTAWSGRSTMDMASAANASARTTGAATDSLRAQVDRVQTRMDAMKTTLDELKRTAEAGTIEEVPVPVGRSGASICAVRGGRCLALRPIAGWWVLPHAEQPGAPVPAGLLSRLFGEGGYLVIDCDAAILPSANTTATATAPGALVRGVWDSRLHAVTGAWTFSPRDAVARCVGGRTPAPLVRPERAPAHDPVADLLRHDELGTRTWRRPSILDLLPPSPQQASPTTPPLVTGAARLRRTDGGTTVSAPPIPPNPFQ